MEKVARRGINIYMKIYMKIHRQTFTVDSVIISNDTVLYNAKPSLFRQTCNIHEHCSADIILWEKNHESMYSR